MTRGGRRSLVARWSGAHVYGHGPRGRRRVRVTECWAVLRAEDVYTALLRDDPSRVTPGAEGTAIYRVNGRDLNASWEVRQNAVWRRGRVFLRCQRCLLRCTRLYIPLEECSPACRQCWGLTYESRTRQNYKKSLWGRGWIARMFGTSQRDWAFSMTGERRLRRQTQSRERWTSRRRLLQRIQKKTTKT